MICLHCGYCCIRLCVPIVDDPVKGPVEGNIVFHEGIGPCKHLQGSKPGEYSYAVHAMPWYNETPCFAHEQYERGNTPCRIGEHLLGSLSKKFVG
jgi:hypothetical protein